MVIFKKVIGMEEYTNHSLDIIGFIMWTTRVFRLSSAAFGRLITREAHTKPLQDKVAILTGSTDGIGLATARRLCEDGAHVVVSSRRPENVQQAVKTIQDDDPSYSIAGVVYCAGKDEESDRKNALIEEAVSRFGSVDIMVAVAGVNPSFGPILKATKSKWEKLMLVNVIAPFLLAKEAIPHMLERGGGSIVFVSTSGASVYVRGLAAYGTSKSCLPMLARMMSQEISRKNIRVNCVEPSLVPTKFSQVLWNEPGMAEELIRRTPLGRFGTVEDCANAIAFLSSNEASYITGETLRVNGGAE